MTELDASLFTDAIIVKVSNLVDYEFPILPPIGSATTFQFQ